MIDGVWDWELAHNPGVAFSSLQRIPHGALLLSLLAERASPQLGVVPLTIYEPHELAAVLPGLRRLSGGRRVDFFLLYEGSLYPAPPWLDSPGSPAHRVFDVPRGPGERFTLFELNVAGADKQPAARTVP